MNGKLSLTLRTIQIYANKKKKVDCRAKPDSPLSYVIFLEYRENPCIVFLAR